MNDLVRWLGVQLDEDERIARAAITAAGEVPGAAEWRFGNAFTDEGGTYWQITTMTPAVDGFAPVELVGSGMSGGGAHEPEIAKHAVEHDPARVLREIDAKRELVQILAHAAKHHEQQSMTLASLALIKMAKVYVDRPCYAEVVQPLLEQPNPERPADE